MKKRKSGLCANVDFPELYFLSKRIKYVYDKHHVDCYLYNLNYKDIKILSKRTDIIRNKTCSNNCYFCFFINNKCFNFSAPMFITKNKGVEYVNPIYIKLCIDEGVQSFKFPKNINLRFDLVEDKYKKLLLLMDNIT